MSTFIKEGILPLLHWQYYIKWRLYNSTSVCLNNSYACFIALYYFQRLTFCQALSGAVRVSLASATSWKSHTSTPTSVYSVSQCRTWLAAGKRCKVAASRQALTCSNHLQVFRQYFSPDCLVCGRALALFTGHVLEGGGWDYMSRGYYKYVWQSSHQNILFWSFHDVVIPLVPLLLSSL